MSNKKSSGFNVDYDIDNDEFRALFQRIETSAQRFSQDEERNQSMAQQEYDSEYEPEYEMSERSGSFNFRKAFASARKNVKKNASVSKNKSKRKIPFVTKLYRASTIMFAALLVLFGFISAVDKNKTVSDVEKRALAEKPKFSFKALFSGDYTVDFENFYSDNFPARNFFISCSNKISETFTRFSLGENADVVVNTQKKDEDFVGEGVDLLGNKKQQNEGMKENTAAVTPDDEATIQNSLLITGNRALEIYYHSDTNAKNYSDVINKTANAMPEGVKFYSMLCPTAMEFYGTAQYREGVHSQRDSIKKVYSLMNDKVITVDAYSNLVDNVEDYIYFRSDHHWTARGAYCGYQAFCKASGNTAAALDSFATHKLEGFLGSLYSTSHSTVLEQNPDYVECFELSVDAKNTVYPSQEMNETDGVPTYIVADEMNTDNKYLAFIAGDQPLEKITTSVRNGKKILVIKESYGNAFVPFLCNNYEEIYVTDPRWINMNLADFVQTNGINEVIAINYMFAIGNQTYLSALSSMTN